MSRYLTIERRLALAIAVVALIVLFLAFQVQEPSTFMPVGPRLFPTIMGGAMLLSAVLLFVLPPRQAPAITTEQVVAEHTDAAVVEGVGEAEEEEQLEWRRVLSLMALTFVYVLLFSMLGFILSTAPFIVGAARILGSRHIVRDIIVGVAVAVGIYLLFTRLLHVGLPSMPFLDI
jgi:putative tricarboxylic transport membrane protein